MNKKRILLVSAAVAVAAAFIVTLIIFAPRVAELAALGLGILPLLGVTSTTNRFQNTPCNVVVANNFDTHGTITRSSVAHLTPSQLEDLFRPSGLFADMDAWFQTSFEMQACGTKVNGLYDWLMSSQRNVGQLVNTQKVDRGPSLLFPFILARQDSVINKEFWAITCGAPISGYTTHASTVACSNGTSATGPLDVTGLTATDRIIRVVSRYGIDMNAGWFQDKDRVFIMTRASNGDAQRGQWKVLASAVAADLSFVDVAIKGENFSASNYSPTPTNGVVMAMGNNVNDFESWCKNRPTLDPRHRVPFWYQTMRRVRSVDSEYKKVFARLMESNDYFRAFGDLPLAERNRQDEEDFQKRWLVTFFFGKPASSQQTLANWQNLESVQTVTGSTVDPGLGGQTIAKRANIIGIYEQLKACGRVKDLQNNKLNLYEFLAENYRIVRARKSQGKTADSIDWFTDSVFAANFESAMVAYYKAEYADIVRINVETGTNELGFQWRSFTVKYPIGVKINIITHEFFDDLVSAADAESMSSTGRFLLCLEMGKPGPRGGTIYPGMITSNRKMRTLGELEGLAKIDPTFACVMEHVTQEITLVSETCTAVCECPANSLWIENIQDAVPVTTGISGSDSTTYANLY